MRRALCVVALLSFAAVWSCSGRRERPALPAPEYERHEVAPYDAGKPQDPLDDDAGDWLDYEDEEGDPPKAQPPNAQPKPPGDAGADTSAPDAGDSKPHAGGGP